MLYHIEPQLIERYRDHLICFQFPQTCVYDGHDREKMASSAKALGDLYLDELIPVFDKVLLKSNVRHTAYSDGYETGDSQGRADMSFFLYRTLRHDLKNFKDKISYALPMVREDFSNKESYIWFQNYLTSMVELFTITAELDDTWRIAGSDVLEMISIRELYNRLNACWHLPPIKNCQFIGDWNLDTAVPKLSLIVLGNLLLNAINHGGGEEIIFKCKLLDAKVRFECLTQKPFSESNRRKFIESSLSNNIPKKHRGFWLCRYILEKRLSGRLIIGEGEKGFKTNLQAELLL